jgi:peptidoglycan/LPS O-acetylase OafA/YrhL
MGQGAVLVFFMITGYLFWSKAIRSNGKVNPIMLWMGRLRRLGPLYMLSALLVLLGSLSALIASSWHDREQYLMRLSSLGLFNWMPLRGFEQTVFNGGVQWSLWFEWRFYLALPLIAWFAVKGRVFILCAIVMACVLATKSSFGTLGAGYWTAFLPGLLAAWLFQKERMRNVLATPVAAIGALIWCVLILGLTKCATIRWNFLSLVPGFFAVAAGNTCFGLLTLPATRLLGTMSYSVYLLHCIILMCSLKMLRSVVDFNQLQLCYYTLILTGIGGLVVIVCSLTYRWLEHPAMQWRTPIERRLSSRKAPARGPEVVSEGQDVPLLKS